MLNPHFISANALYMSPYIFGTLNCINLSQQGYMLIIELMQMKKMRGKKPGICTIRVSNLSSRAHSVDGSNISYSRLV